MTFQPRYTARYIKHHRTFRSLRARIDSVEARILADPYVATELLGSKGRLNLQGCRSARVGRNFRIIFVVCEECRKEPDCDYCYCEGLRIKRSSL